ncbi:MAG: hypothetical protein EZS28_000040 [Streblomastix strix]|uniref:Uncharacterized protein n=1 Tax=Streblomastix strix TaxID=222440 RepID=A0A5J4XD26_9EUKA|nr:MAG: hypothetical protein EZS28_000040 [Streblomastix strix]
MSDEYEDQVVEAPVDENEKVISARDEQVDLGIEFSIPVGGEQTENTEVVEKEFQPEVTEQIVSWSAPPPEENDIVALDEFKGPPPGTTGKITSVCDKCQKKFRIPQKPDGSIDAGITKCSCGRLQYTGQCNNCGDLLEIDAQEYPIVIGHGKCGATFTAVICTKCHEEHHYTNVDGQSVSNKLLRCACGFRFLYAYCTKCKCNLTVRAEGLPTIVNYAFLFYLESIQNVAMLHIMVFANVCGEILLYDEEAIPGLLNCGKCQCKFSAIPCPECKRITHYLDNSKKFFYRCPHCQFRFYGGLCRCNEFLTFDAAKVPGGLKHSRCGNVLQVAECPVYETTAMRSGSIKILACSSSANVGTRSKLRSELEMITERE